MRVGLVYAYIIGEDEILHTQTEGRCRKALKLWRAGKIDEIVLVCACKVGKKFECDIMKKWFLDEDVPIQNIRTFPWGYNTVGETEGCETFYALSRKRVKITAISSWYHLPRIWCLWLIRGRIVGCAPSFTGMFTRDILFEPIKFFNSLARPFSSAKTIEKNSG